MTLIHFNEKFSGTLSIDKVGQRDLQRVFQGITDNPRDDGTRVLAEAWASGRLPLLYTFYQCGTGFDTGSVLVNITPTRDMEQPCNWTVTCDYTSNYLDPDKADPNPLNHAPDIDWNFNPYQSPLIKDAVTGEAVLNSANSQPDPLPEIDDALMTLRITRNLPYYPQYAYADYMNTVNETWFAGGAPACWKVVAINGNRQNEGGIFYWPTTFEFHYRRPDSQDGTGGWIKQILDSGFTEVAAVRELGGQVKRIRIVDGRGDDVPEPALLNGKGLKLPDGDDPVFLKFNGYPQRDLNALPTGLSVAPSGGPYFIPFVPGLGAPPNNGPFFVPGI